MKSKYLAVITFLMPLLTFAASQNSNGHRRPDLADQLLNTYVGTNSAGELCSFAFVINSYHPGEIDLVATNDATQLDHPDYTMVLQFDLRSQINKQLKSGLSQLLFTHERQTMYDATDRISIELDADTHQPISINSTQEGMGGKTQFDCSI